MTGSHRINQYYQNCSGIRSAAWLLRNGFHIPVIEQPQIYYILQPASLAGVFWMCLTMFIEVGQCPTPTGHLASSDTLLGTSGKRSQHYRPFYQTLTDIGPSQTKTGCNFNPNHLKSSLLLIYTGNLSRHYEVHFYFTLVRKGRNF